MKVWLGHYSDNLKEWFIVWDDRIEDAWDNVDQVGSPEMNSLREIVSAGMANFHSDRDGDDETISPAKDKTRRERWLYLGTESMLENPNEYIASLNSERIANQNFKMKIWRGSYLSENQEDGEDCFVVWAKDKEEALQIVEQNFGNVDKDSLIEVRNEGFIDFHVSMQAGKPLYTPPKDDVESGFWINLRGIM